MESTEFVRIIRDAQKGGKSTLSGTFHTKHRGCIRFQIQIDGFINGNIHDLWIMKPGGDTLGRAYLGSKKKAQNLDGWPALIKTLTDRKEC